MAVSAGASAEADGVASVVADRTARDGTAAGEEDGCRTSQIASATLMANERTTHTFVGELFCRGPGTLDSALTASILGRGRRDSQCRILDRARSRTSRGCFWRLQPFSGQSF